MRYRFRSRRWPGVAIRRNPLEPVLERIDPYLAGVEAQGTWPAAARAIPKLAEALVTAGRPDDARDLVERLAGAVVGLDAPLAPAALRHARGHLALAAGRGGAADEFGAAGCRYEELGCRYEAALAGEHEAIARFAAVIPVYAKPCVKAL